MFSTYDKIPMEYLLSSQSGGKSWSLLEQVLSDAELPFSDSLFILLTIYSFKLVFFFLKNFLMAVSKCATSTHNYCESWYEK